MTLAQPLPTQKDEAWRYADLKAVETIWQAVDAPEPIIVDAGQSAQQLLVLESGDARMRQLHVVLEEGARMDLACLAFAPAYGRIEIDIDVASGAHFEMGGAIVGSGEQTLEIVTRVNHHAPDATSHQTVRSVLAEKATGSFLGKITIARDAQRIDAEQSVKSMLLDRGATANAKPELEIYADDVKCAHGATVGELDKQALFYMASRGLDPQAAKRLMLHAFVAEAFVDVAADTDGVEEQALAALEALL
ncbi:Fe-S cluster assembly protein SufD [Parasphingorhabdus marina DSM 22363]|uniref:Fe-S cluster assembly protein SufD n=1 Tax=Parasphingorhabdus marina DSM 22363 TaxID=1123272 RepID=A0A1N6CNA9_9SPHN|nr:SufD family Fe-S cluster assembly protein [Parasphingorhabdus marina]SIN59986.1 Fe-S cluster assembly protein SufD [Parasphingorhabdus marina DSM 22363]